MCHEEDLGLLQAAAAGELDNPRDLLNVRSQSYDLVINGWELGSGGVRIHRSEVQQTVFSLLGISDEQAERNFGFLLEALRYGAPPHAGFAYGIDRLVAILAGEDNIREVIAFPMNQKAQDLMMNAPSDVTEKQLRELHIKIRGRELPGDVLPHQ